MDLVGWLTRYLNRRVSINVGVERIVGELTHVDEESLRLINTRIPQSDSDSWFERMQADSDLEAVPETVVPMNMVLGVSCLDPEVAEVPLPTVANGESGDGSDEKPPDATGHEKFQRQPDASPHDLEPHLQVDPIEIRIGLELIRLADPARGGCLLDRISNCRATIAEEFGFAVPKIRVRDDLMLAANSYRIYVNDSMAAKGELDAGRVLAIDYRASDSNEPLEGRATVDPAFGMPAWWIEPDSRAAAECRGFHVVEPQAVLATHLLQVVKSRAPELLTLEGVEYLVEVLREQYPATVGEFFPHIVSLRVLHCTLRQWLAERLPIHGLRRILESLAAHVLADSSGELSELVRRDLVETIWQDYAHDGRLHVLRCDDGLRRFLGRVVQSESVPTTADVDSDQWQCFIRQLREDDRGQSRPPHVVLVTDTALRLPLWQLLRRVPMFIGVLSDEEARLAEGIAEIDTLRLVESDEVATDCGSEDATSEANSNIMRPMRTSEGNHLSRDPRGSGRGDLPQLRFLSRWRSCLSPTLSGRARCPPRLQSASNALSATGPACKACPKLARLPT